MKEKNGGTCMAAFHFCFQEGTAERTNETKKTRKSQARGGGAHGGQEEEEEEKEEAEK